MSDDPILAAIHAITRRVQRLNARLRSVDDKPSYDDVLIQYTIATAELADLADMISSIYPQDTLDDTP